MYMYILNDFKVITVLFSLHVSVNDSWGCKGINNHVKIIVWLHVYVCLHLAAETKRWLAKRQEAKERIWKSE